MLGLDTYTHSVVCTTNTKVFILDNKNIERLVHKKNPHTLDKLRQIVQVKLRSRTCMRVGSQIPLYKRLLDKIQGTQAHQRLGATRLRDDEEKPKTIAETIADRDVMVAQLSKLFFQNKTPFIEPSVPGTLYYLTKSAERAKRKSASYMMQARKGITNGRVGESRLYRARSAPRRQPRSRRELERLTLASAVQDTKQSQTGDKSRSKYYMGGVQNRRPISAIQLADVSNHALVKDAHEVNAQISGDQVHLGYNDIVNSDVKEVAKEIKDRQQATNASRSKVICSMLDRQNEKNDITSTICRPKSAPTQTCSNDDEDDEDEIESFDWETSNHALKELEDKLRSFYIKNGAGHGFKKSNANVIELKRFNIQGPDDVPIPGGTVYVRQRTCQFAGGPVSSAAHHQHIRRYIIPKDAYRVAVRCISVMEDNVEEPTRCHTSQPSNVNKPPPTRPLSSAPRTTTTRTINENKGNNRTTSTRIQSAPLKRNSFWT
ncbi:hypothetical protein LSH36_721g02025 [Paralvinella palmiformis]|uniref:Uncharacterized protein n=1 Tax=Paralvinella palmiformis TaxID=53620 RepID=A0AAD9J239_9ANNE|nr:hypothetical protein LSH36_721g02025 [Paralvinella palmiformis]